MPGHVKVSGTWKALTGLHTRVSGTWKQVQAGYVKVSGVWKQFYLFFSAVADDMTPSGSASGASPTGLVTSDTTTVTPTGGTPPYTYAWAQGPGGASASGPFTPGAPNADATNWSDTVTEFETAEDWTCTVTDDDSNETTVTVAVSLNWTDTS